MDDVTYIKLFVDYLDAIELLGDAERGRLFTALLEYARTGEAPQLCGNERFIFPMMRAQVDRDIALMREGTEKKSRAGKAGASARASKSKHRQAPLNGDKQCQAPLSSVKQCQAPPSKDYDKDEDKDKDKDEDEKKPQGGSAGRARKSHEEEIRAIVAYLNQKAGTSYRASTKETRKHIKARLEEHFTVEEFKTVIDKKVRGWLHDQEMSKFLRPQTLFGTKFESYLNEPETERNGNNNPPDPYGDGQDPTGGHFTL